MFPPFIDIKEKVFYRSYIYKLPNQIKIYKQIFKQNLNILLLDDLKKDVYKTYISLAKFLNIDLSFTPKFKIENPNKIPRSYIIRDILKKNGVRLGKLRKIFISKPIGLIKNIQKMNTQTIKRKPLDKKLKNKLLIEFLPIVSDLEHIINRDLSHWKI